MNNVRSYEVLPADAEVLSSEAEADGYSLLRVEQVSLDMYILLRTVGALFSRRGAY